MKKYRIYALIHGQTLPTGSLLDCEIRKIAFAEQEQRKFEPIQAEIYEEMEGDNHTSYVTSLAFIDPIYIKSEYVVFCNLNEHDASGALGAAIRKIDKLCRLLSLTCHEDNQQFYNMPRLPFQPYIYQINKIYLIDENDEETDADAILNHSHVYLPNRPENNNWLQGDSTQLLEELYAAHDNPLDRALKYLYRSSIGGFILDSPEKIALDHSKTIEIILGAVSNKESFELKLADAVQKLHLNEGELSALRELWQVRSDYGDIAHPSLFDQAERYPNQFPIPSNSSVHPVPSLAFAANICLKYFRYIQRLFYVDLKEPRIYTSLNGERKTTDGQFAVVNSTTETNHLIFYAAGNKQQLLSKLRRSFIDYQHIQKSDIEDISVAAGYRSVKILIKQRS